jgi:tetratricopeptide (TPR) repeat protein
MFMKPHVLTGLIVTVGLTTIMAQPSLQASPAISGNQPSLSSANEAEAYNDRGVELAEQGKLAQAIAAFNQAIKISPKFENAHNNLGLALGSQNKFSEAAAAFKRALAINPKNFETYNNLGIALGSQGKLPEAVAAFNQFKSIPTIPLLGKT